MNIEPANIQILQLSALFSPPFYEAFEATIESNNGETEEGGGGGGEGGRGGRMGSSEFIFFQSRDLRGF